MIVLDKVCKYYNKGKKNEIPVIDHTSIKLDKTGLVCLLGSSGSGKTTLLNAIGGLEKVNKGNIYINNQKITKRSMKKVDKIRNLNIGYIFQDYKLIDNLSVYENIAIGLKMIGIKDKEEIKKRVNYVLETLNIYRFRNRPASMLSGGERQRVGIARAIVKDPDILLADEPTGNLDSKNSLEIMNIIKSISKNRLVILVTHETSLAKFYATRIIEIVDGKIVKDYENKNNTKLDYRLESNIYLKDIDKHLKINKENNQINLYNETDQNLDLTIVLRKGNIYIKANNNEKLEVIDQNSNIQLIDEHYKELDHEEIDKYEFNFKNIINKDIPKKYSSIYGPISLLVNGFKKILNYSFIKKVLLLGYFAASMFILFSISRIYGVSLIEDKDFISENKTYIQIDTAKLTVQDYEKYTDLSNINYAFPSSSKVSFQVKYSTFYQATNAEDIMSGSISADKLISSADLIYGHMPNSDEEIVVDKMVLDDLIASDYNYTYAKMAGLTETQDFINLEVYQNNDYTYKIVGISDLGSPCIYAKESSLINIIYDTYSYDSEELTYKDYNFADLTLKKGTLPLNDYEAVINYNQKDSYPIGKKLENKINGKELKVVGYYTSSEDSNLIYVNSNMIKYDLINKSSAVTISADNKEEVISELNDNNINAKDLYNVSKNEYIKEKKSSVKSVIIFSSIIIAISLIEILLMIRSSFLSRIKEVGIYRAIGVKKSDIYKMFLGEILAISLTASLGGVLLMSYILINVSKIKYLSDLFVINIKIVILAYLICLVFNIVIGLLPVASTIRKRPAQILARNDI